MRKQIFRLLEYTAIDILSVIKFSNILRVSSMASRDILSFKETVEVPSMERE